MKRVLNTTPALFVEIYRKKVLHWLNSELPKQHYSRLGKQRIEALIDELNDLSRESRKRSHNRGWVFPSLGPSDGGIARNHRLNLEKVPRELQPRALMVSALISRYPSTKRLAWSGNRLNFLDDLTLLMHLQDDITLLRGVTVSEAGTAHCAMSLAELGELEWLLRCNCGRWFFARRSTQKSCSPICRHKLYEQTDAFKEKRRAYMKEYNRLKASGKVK